MSRPPLNAALLLAVLTAPLGLAACADQGPWPMPTGYTYENGRYHSPPGPQPVVKKIETEHFASDHPAAPASATVTSSTMTDTTMTTTSVTETGNAGGGAAGPLVDKLFGDFGKPAEPVWIQPAAGSDASPAFDGQLRAALDAKGVKVSDTVGGGPFGIRYAIAPGEDGKSHVTLSLTSGGMKAAEASGDIDLGGGATTVSSHTDESHSSEKTIVTGGADDVPAGPAALPPSGGEPTPLTPIHTND